MTISKPLDLSLIFLQFLEHQFYNRKYGPISNISPCLNLQELPELMLLYQKQM